MAIINNMPTGGKKNKELQIGDITREYELVDENFLVCSGQQLSIGTEEFANLAEHCHCTYSVPIAASGDGSGYTKLGISVRDIIYENGFYVAVGEGGKIAVTTEIIHYNTVWTIYDISDYSETLERVVYGNDRFVAVGGSTKCIVSTDAVNWSVYEIGGSVNRITYANGMFVGVGSSGTLAYSTDAINWTVTKAFGTTSMSGIMYKRGLFIATTYANGRLYTSIDGINWTQRSLPYSSYSHIGDYQFGLFGIIQGSSQTRTLCTSTDGITWTARSSFNNVYYATRLHAYCGKWVAYGDDGYIGFIPGQATGTSDDTTIGESTIRTVLFKNGKYFIGYNQIIQMRDGEPITLPIIPQGYIKYK